MATLRYAVDHYVDPQAVFFSSFFVTSASFIYFLSPCDFWLRNICQRKHTADISFSGKLYSLWNSNLFQFSTLCVEEVYILAKQIWKMLYRLQQTKFWAQSYIYHWNKDVMHMLWNVAISAYRVFKIALFHRDYFIWHLLISACDAEQVWKSSFTLRKISLLEATLTDSNISAVIIPTNKNVVAIEIKSGNNNRDPFISVQCRQRLKYTKLFKCCSKWDWTSESCVVK